MKRFLLIVLIFITIQSVNFGQSPVIQNIINQTNLDSLTHFVRELSGEVSTIIGGSPYTIVSRNKNNASNNMAANYIKQKLDSYGLVTYDQWWSGTGRNVYGVQLGSQYPNKKYIICAHYDDMPSGATAPGADDNASGTAAVLEAARIFTQYDSKYTIIYALWDEEEQGLVGSAYYAQQAALAGDSIMGVINMDMTAWDNDNDSVGEIHVRNYANSNALKDLMIQVNTTYSIGITPVVENPGTTASDHASFWNNGYGAILLIEEYYGGDFNAYYHSVNDKIQYYNQPYYHKMSKLAYGTVATLAQLTDIVPVEM
ncbi:MAG: Zn-dependent exopeptidase M28, partial [Chlorobiota bacterium]